MQEHLLHIFLEMLLIFGAAERTMQFEGYRECPYPDGVQYAIGYGRAVGKDEPCTDEESERNFVITTLTEHHKVLKARVKGYDQMPMKVKRVLLDMMYNLGEPRFFKFKNTLTHIENGDYDKASDNLLKSKYARQVKTRARANAKLLREA